MNVSAEGCASSFEGLESNWLQLSRSRSQNEFGMNEGGREEMSECMDG